MNKQKPVSENHFNANEYPLTPGVGLIEASAGTGKTFALTHLVLRLLTEGGYSLKQILVVTFTDAAAAELKARIGLRLESALKGLEAIEKGDKKEYSDQVMKQWLEKHGKEKHGTATRTDREGTRRARRGRQQTCTARNECTQTKTRTARAQ